MYAIVNKRVAVQEVEASALEADSKSSPPPKMQHQPREPTWCSAESAELSSPPASGRWAEALRCTADIPKGSKHLLLEVPMAHRLSLSGWGLLL